MRRLLKFTLLIVALVSGFAPLTRPAHALTFLSTEFVCPIGGEKFTAKVVASFSQFGIRLDLKPIGALIAPIPLPVCPENGFVMYQERFSDDEIELLKPIVLSDDYRRARQKHTDYYMAAYLRERIGAEDVELATLYLKASWEAEGKPDLLERYRTLALEKLDGFLVRDNSHSDQWWFAAILAPELERLLGHFDAAETRIGKLPVDRIDASSAQRRALEQIRSHARNHDRSPQKFVVK